MILRRNLNYSGIDNAEKYVVCSASTCPYQIFLSNFFFIHYVFLNVEQILFSKPDYK